MKTLSLLISILFLSLSFSSVGQKIKDKKVLFHYVNLPAEKLSDDFQTYSVRVYGSAISKAGLSAQKLAKSINMDGFKRLSGSGNDYGHLRVSVYTGYISTGRVEPKSSSSKRKDKKTGKETTTYSYWYEIPFEGNGSYKVVDPEGNILAEGNSPHSQKLATKKYSKSSDRSKNYSAQINKIKKDFAKSVVTGVMNNARTTIRQKYDYARYQDWRNLYFLKKHDTAKDFDKYFDLTKETFATLKKGITTEKVDAVKTKLQPAMDFWKKTGEIKPADKKAKRVYRAANYNYALVSYFLGDLESAKEYANKVVESEGKDRKSKILLKDIEATQKKMDFHGINTMFYVRDLSGAKAPAKVKAFEEEKEELEADNNTVTAVLMMGGNEIKGSVLQSKGADEMFFGPKGNTKFMAEEDGKMKEYDLTAEEVSAFTLGERKFIKTRFNPSAKGKGESAMHILEVVYDSEKIKLYKYFPSSGVLGQEKTEFAFQKASDDFPLSVEDTQFLLWKKGLAKYFGDCADLKDMCTEGGIKKNQEDLVKAARIYSELCE
ncbi:MAG: hypothetical protein AB8H03_25455 [Saprospiraceae bacterium]